MTKLAGSIVAAALVGWVHAAGAQTFPADEDWTPFECGDDPMTDALRDEPTAVGPRDVVGDADAPAGYRAFDDEFLYLRLRVDEDPTMGTGFQPFAWGVEIDLDDDPTTYELLMLLEGEVDAVGLYENTETMSSDDPGDPADQPAVASYDARTHAAARVLGGSSFGGNDDFAVDLAVPWSDLEPLGFEVDTAVTVWVGTSSGITALDGDLACHDGGDGDPTLSDAGSDAATADPETDTDGDGFTDEEEIRSGSDPEDADSTPGVVAGDGQLEGGGGCAAAGETSSATLLLLGLAAALYRGRRHLRGRG